MKVKKLPWIILFGGAGRSKAINEISKSGIHVKMVIVPKKQSIKLKKDILGLKKAGSKIIEVGKKNIAEVLEAHTDSLLLTIGFPYIVPKSVFSKHPMALNVHPTLLPKYRGAMSGAYVLINNEKYSGSTVHIMTDEADKGAIVSQIKVELSPFDTLRSMQRKVYSLESRLIFDSISKLEEGIKPKDQDENLSSMYPKLRTPEDSVIDPSKPLIELIDQIRATDFDEFPPFFYYHGEKVNVKLWRDYNSANDEDEI